MPEVTIEEIQKAIGSLAKRNSLSEYDIPIELLKMLVSTEGKKIMGEIPYAPN